MQTYRPPRHLLIVAALALLAEAQRLGCADAGVYTEAAAACERCGAPDLAARYASEAKHLAEQ